MLRAPCPRPERPEAPTVGALAGFSVRQEGAISVCEARKDAVIAAVDAANAVGAPVVKRAWWKRIFPSPPAGEGGAQR